METRKVALAEKPKGAEKYEAKKTASVDEAARLQTEIKNLRDLDYLKGLSPEEREHMIELLEKSLEKVSANIERLSGILQEFETFELDELKEAEKKELQVKLVAILSIAGFLVGSAVAITHPVSQGALPVHVASLAAIAGSASGLLVLAGAAAGKLLAEAGVYINKMKKSHKSNTPNPT